MEKEQKPTYEELEALYISQSALIEKLKWDSVQASEVEDMLRTSEEKFSGAFHANPALMAISPLGDGSFVDVNSTFLEVLGYKREEVIGKTSRELGIFVDYEQRKYIVEMLRSNNIVRNYEVDVRDKNNNIHHGIFSAKRLSISNEPYMLTVLIDITERNEAEEALHLDEQRLEALLELNQMSSEPLEAIAAFAMEEAVRLTKSKIGYVAFVDEEETTLTMHAWSKEALQECAISNKPIVYPLEMTGLWGEAVRQRRPVITNDYNASSPLKKGIPDGHVRILRHMNVPVFDGGKIVVVAGVGNKKDEYDQSDIRQLSLLMSGMWKIAHRKQIEETLRMEREQVFSIFDSIDEIIYVADPQTYELVFANKVMKKKFGEDCIGDLCYKRIQGLDAPCEFCTNDKIFGDNAVPVYIWEHHNKKLDIWVKCIDRAIKWPDGRLLRYEMAIDVTGLKRAERKLQEQNDLLEELVEQRTLELRDTQDKLVESERLAIIGSLSGGISHELRNPLAIIAGSVFFLKKRIGSEDEKGLAHLEMIRKQIDACVAIIENVLSLTRLQSPRPDVVPVAEIVEAALYQASKHEGTRVSFLKPDPPVTIFADRGQLAMAFKNIMDNAFHSMNDGGTLTISISDEIIDSQHSAVVKFTDTGCGIPHENLMKIFQPLFTTKSKGIGFGLAIVKSVIERHKGSITVESKPGEGTTFTVQLPSAVRAD